MKSHPIYEIAKARATNVEPTEDQRRAHSDFTISRLVDRVRNSNVPREQSKRSTYAIAAVGTGKLKIGRAIDVDNRVRNIQAMCPVELRLIAVCSVDIEQHLHRMLAGWRQHGEWFRDTDEVRTVITIEMDAAKEKADADR